MGNFSQNLEKQLKLTGITKAELSRMSGISKSTIQQWDKKGAIPKADAALTISRILKTSVEALLTGETSFDPAEMYMKKDPELRSLVIKLGLHPELIPRVDAYLEGYMESHGYNLDADKKEGQSAG
ncbi:MAG: helix-turn-helix transcriptional regulator [Spirochaetales bacterium]|nr:helix-turn-helix transcriptional regulator [Spirochaetales bacterium]